MPPRAAVQAAVLAAQVAVQARASMLSSAAALERAPWAAVPAAAAVPMAVQQRTVLPAGEESTWFCTFTGPRPWIPSKPLRSRLQQGRWAASSQELQQRRQSRQQGQQATVAAAGWQGSPCCASRRRWDVGGGVWVAWCGWFICSPEGCSAAPAAAQLQPACTACCSSGHSCFSAGNPTDGKHSSCTTLCPNRTMTTCS